MDKMLKVALMLTAIDKMSSVVATATGKSLNDISKVQKGIQSMRDGMLMMAAGKQGFDLLSGPVEAFGKLQAAGNRLQTSLMRDGGVLDTKIYDKMIAKSQQLSEKYANTSEEYLNMMRLLKNNGIKEEDILGTVGEANEKLAVALEVAPSTAAMFVAHMKRDMGIANKDMEGMMDLIARLHNVGVGETGADAIAQMNQFFSKEGLSAGILKSLGLEESKSVAAIAGLFIRRGLSGQTVGTNFRRMLDTMRNPKAMKEVQEQAAKYGVTIDLFDKKTKQFLGFDNMIHQFNKLRGLDVQSIDKITHAFGGRQGLSNDFISLLATEGVKDFNEVMSDMYKQASLNDKINVLITGQEYKVKRLSAAWFNFKANFGAALAPSFEVIINKLTAVTQGIASFARHHPTISRYIGSFIALASTVILVAGAIKIFRGALMVIDGLIMFTSAIKWLRIAMVAYQGQLYLATGAQVGFAGAVWAATVALLANPITWVIVGLVALGVAIYMVIKHWTKVKEFLSAFGTWVMYRLGIVWDFLKLLFKWSPLGLMIQAWTPLITFFRKIGDSIERIFISIIAWFYTLGPRFMKAGANIIASIVMGIKSKAHEVVNSVRGIAASIRAFFPFSPAKEGPLRDIHRVRLIETIADSLRADSILSKMRSISGAIFDFKLSQTPQQVAGGFAGGGGGIVLAPVFNYHAAPGESGQNSQMADWFRKNSRIVLSMLEEELARRNRLKY